MKHRVCLLKHCHTNSLKALSGRFVKFNEKPYAKVVEIKWISYQILIKEDIWSNPYHAHTAVIAS